MTAMLKTSLKLRNSWKYIGDEKWEWNAFIDDGNTGELNEVDNVEYILHPTFRNPIRKIIDRRSKFELKTSGWGTFELKAFVYKKDGSKIKLTHEVKLEQNPEVGITPYATPNAYNRSNKSIDVQLIEKTIYIGIIQLAKDSLKDYLPQAEVDAQKISYAIKNDIQTWATQLAVGAITADDLKFLLRGNQEIVEMVALTQAGIKAIQLDQFKESVSNLIVNTLNTVI
ncbi:MAG TPA: pYEATS domain-containing protein [Bacteroidia bacterium]|jgi:transcription initiation factor IIF auxiliary subunit|nr:pYEATS domain-containing protein [Bacteroidia bacterium]